MFTLWSQDMGMIVDPYLAFNSERTGFSWPPLRTIFTDKHQRFIEQVAFDIV